MKNDKHGDTNGNSQVNYNFYVLLKKEQFIAIHEISLRSLVEECSSQ